jgi:hypothetical protein
MAGRGARVGRRVVCEQSDMKSGISTGSKAYVICSARGSISVGVRHAGLIGSDWMDLIRARLNSCNLESRGPWQDIGTGETWN